MAAYKLAVENPSQNVVIFRQNSNTLIMKGSGDVFKWFEHRMISIPIYNCSNDNRHIWREEGAGGELLHFGLQYIDSRR